MNIMQVMAAWAGVQDSPNQTYKWFAYADDGSIYVFDYLDNDMGLLRWDNAKAFREGDAVSVHFKNKMPHIQAFPEKHYAIVENAQAQKMIVPFAGWRAASLSSNEFDSAVSRFGDKRARESRKKKGWFSR